MLEFILHCEDVEYIIGRRLKELKSSFRQFILDMYKDKELYELLIEDFPNFERLVNKITKIESKNGEEDDEEFECEICFKKISKEEYELNDGLCEDCFFDIHTDLDGNFHDDECFDE